MSNIAIKAENISKLYRLGEVGTGTISHDLNRWMAKIRGKEDPFAVIGETNDRTQKGKSDYVWSLKDVDFEVQQGDAVGIIGRNGAGKSTLLKLLSKVTKPSSGKIYTKGRIASLLEVGTGFHPEMTGRENIFLNGAILGMTRNEIKRKFDEIVAFSGVERYIDTPVKRYSSGMYVRLAFAVAAHLESEILIVDEVLAVGDAEFQKKCLGKMNDVSKGEGRTVLFVSHSMASIRKLCTKGLVLRNGESIIYTEAEEAVSFYENQLIGTDRTLEIIYEKDTNSAMCIQTATLVPIRQNKIFNTSDALEFNFKIFIKDIVEGAYLTIDIKDVNDELIYWTADYTSDRYLSNLKGAFTLSCKLPKGLLTAGFYNASFAISSPLNGVVFNQPNLTIIFEVEESQLSFLSQYNINHPGKTAIESEWKIIF